MRELSGGGGGGNLSSPWYGVVSFLGFYFPIEFRFIMDMVFNNCLQFPDL